MASYNRRVPWCDTKKFTGKRNVSDIWLCSVHYLRLDGHLSDVELKAAMNMSQRMKCIYEFTCVHADRFKQLTITAITHPWQEHVIFNYITSPCHQVRSRKTLPLWSDLTFHSLQLLVEVTHLNLSEVNGLIFHNPFICQILSCISFSYASA